MFELVIAGKKADIREDIAIQFNYKTTDVESPVAVSNNFSVSFDLDGTQANNDIFGSIYKLDRRNNDGDDNSSMNFDPNKRVDFSIYLNGNVVESGYLQLNTIKVKGEDVKYNVTLNGNLGDFFFNLMYDENGNEKTLQDLYFGWKDTLEEENTSILGQYNREFINDGWLFAEGKEKESKVTPIDTNSIAWYDESCISSTEGVVWQNNDTGLPKTTTTDNSKYIWGGKLKASDYVNIAGHSGERLIFKNLHMTGYQRTPVTAGLAFYDINKKFISGEKIKVTDLPAPTSWQLGAYAAASGGVCCQYQYWKLPYFSDSNTSSYIRQNGWGRIGNIYGVGIITHDYYYTLQKAYKTPSVNSFDSANSDTNWHTTDEVFPSYDGYRRIAFFHELSGGLTAEATGYYVNTFNFMTIDDGETEVVIPQNAAYVRFTYASGQDFPQPRMVKDYDQITVRDYDISNKFTFNNNGYIDVNTGEAISYNDIYTYSDYTYVAEWADRDMTITFPNNAPKNAGAVFYDRNYNVVYSAEVDNTQLDYSMTIYVPKAAQYMRTTYSTENTEPFKCTVRLVNMKTRFSSFTVSNNTYIDNAGAVKSANGWVSIGYMNVSTVQGMEFCMPIVEVSSKLGFVPCMVQYSSAYSPIEVTPFPTHDGDVNVFNEKILKGKINPNAYFVKTSYLNGTVGASTMDFYFNFTAPYNKLITDMVAITTYNGLYDNFDNNKCLIDVNSVEGDATNYLPKLIYKDGINYTPRNGYALLTMPRDLVEWEARDLRALNQRFGIKFSKLFNAIANPENNGGYNVFLSSKIQNSPYFKDTYVMFNKPDWENQNVISEYTLTGTHTAYENSIYDYLILKNNEDGVVFDLAGIDTPNIQATLNTQMDVYAADGPIGWYINQNTFGEFYNSSFYSDQSSQSQRDWTYTFRWAGVVVRCEMYDTDERYLGSTPAIFYSNVKNYNVGNVITADIENRLMNAVATYLTSRYPDTPYNEINAYNYEKEYLTTRAEGVYRYGTTLEFNGELPRTDEQVKLRLSFRKVKVEATAYQYDRTNPYGWSITVDNSPTRRWVDNNNYNGNEFAPRYMTYTLVDSYILDSEGNSMLGDNHLSKAVLFGNSKSPYKYLTDFTKMFNLKYIYDKQSKTIQIKTIDEYYLNEINELTADIENGIDIEPTVIKYKTYDVGLETPESYAAYLYNKRNVVDYGTKSLGTTYQFNKTTKEVLEGNIYKNLIPYKLSSYYFKSTNLPSVVLSDSYKYTLWNEDSSYELPIGVVWENYGFNYDDSSSRLCVFDKDNKYMEDVDNAFVFLSGWEKSKQLIISDNFDDMMEINGNPCFFYTTDPQKAIINPDVPIFNKVYGDYTLDFSKPTAVFANSLYGNKTKYVYNTYWERYFNDLYDKNTTQITMKVFLKEEPAVALRKFYFYDGCYWVLNEIKNYMVGSDDPCECVFVRVNDLDNYLNIN